MTNLGTTRLVEMNRNVPFHQEADKGVNLEVSMAATIFRDLQNAGYIDEGAKLADEPPKDGEGLEGTSYEARFVELITDENKNGQLDIDLDRLRESGMLKGSPDNKKLAGALTGKPREVLSDSFIGRQNQKSELCDRFGNIQTKGRRVQRYSKGMVLTTEQDRSNDEFLAQAGNRAAQSPAEAKKLADEATGSAHLLLQRGNQRHAQELLSGTGNQLMDAGRLDEAARVFGELKKAPYAKTKCNLVQNQINNVKASSPEFDPNRHVISSQSDNGTEIKVSSNKYKSTYGELADIRLNQIDQRKQMEQVLGRTVDPRNTGDAREYFQRFAEGKGTNAVREEYQTYLTNFYNHAGEGVEWTNKIPENQRPGRVNELLQGQPEDDAGRRIIDCEGYTYLTENLLGGVTDKKGNQRFDVSYASRPGHIIAGVQDRSSGQGFTVNNNSCDLVQKMKSRRALHNALGSELCGGYPNIVGIGSTPSSASPYASGEAVPRIGAYVYDGSSVGDQVGPGLQQQYRSYLSSAFTPSFNHFLVNANRRQ